MSIWYEITPVDTLFFRGAEAMEAGQLSSDALFPPPVSVLEGALRTALLRQQQIPFAAYNAGNCSGEIFEQIGRSGEKAPFSIIMIFFRKDGVDYVPCPANLFVEEKLDTSSLRITEKNSSTVKIHRAVPKPTASEKLKFRTSARNYALPLVVADEEIVPLAGHWLKRDLLKKLPDTLTGEDILASTDLYDMEPRTGIALDPNRKVIESKLYSTGHIRLRYGVSIIIAIDRYIGLADTGMLALGGEKRMSGYTTITASELSSPPAAAYMTLAPVELTDALMPAIISAHKPLVLAGWDLHTGFHKPTTTWLPAGSVFSYNINNHCVPLAN
ncbi:MAG: type III-B CRISPR module-associated Cmr3 family protein [Desulfocapsaceae bacterium]|nr:type III-B CRISPR module-associated Cmr3 family protein [Desulfocapsaceae bacterium]